MSYLVADRTGSVSRIRLLERGATVSNDSVYWDVSAPKKHALVLTRVPKHLAPHYIGGSYANTGAIHALSLTEISAILTNILGLSVQEEGRARRVKRVGHAVLALSALSSIMVLVVWMSIKTVALMIFWPVLILWLGRRFMH